MNSTVKYINPEGACPAQGLYSHLTKVTGGTLYFVAGQLSVGSGGEVVGKGNFEVQFDQVFTNMAAVLKGIDADFNDVVKFNTYMVHSQDLEKFMECRTKKFPSLFATSAYPPNTLVVIDRLVKEDFLLEVEAVVKGKAD